MLSTSLDAMLTLSETDDAIESHCNIEVVIEN